MWKTFFVAVTDMNDEFDLAVLLENSIQIFLNENLDMVEVERSAPSLAATPVGQFNGYFNIFMSVTSRFEKKE